MSNLSVPDQDKFPKYGLLRIWQIVGDKKRGIEPVIPVSKSSWWAGVASGKYPQPRKLGCRTTVWRASDVQKLIDELF